jgi:hypothetical protein
MGIRVKANATMKELTNVKLNWNIIFIQKMIKGIKAIERTKDNAILSTTLIFPLSKKRKLQEKPGINNVNRVPPMD